MSSPGGPEAGEGAGCSGSRAAVVVLPLAVISAGPAGRTYLQGPGGARGKLAAAETRRGDTRRWTRSGDTLVMRGPHNDRT